MIPLAVWAESDVVRAKALADSLGLLLLGEGENWRDADAALLVLIDKEGVGVVSPMQKILPVRVDFLHGKMAWRRAHSHKKDEAIAKAVGLHQAKNLTIWDATAGLGRDAFVLATLGAFVHMSERSAVVAALLADGLARAAMDEEVAPIIARMVLHTGDSLDLLANTTIAPDVIYVDPMFPHRDKTALVKKEMRIFRDLVGEDEDASALLEVARAKATYRVVVKRPITADPLAGVAPSHSIEGKAGRFDVYTKKSFSKEA